METDLSSRHCVHSLPEVRPTTYPETSTTTTIRGGPGQPSMHCCPLDDPHKDPQVFLQPGAQEVKFMLGPTPAQRHLMERDRDRHVTHPHRAPDGSSETEGEETPSVHMCNTHSYHHCHHLMHRHPSMEHCPESQLTYENINGLRGARRQRLSPSTVSQSQSLGSSSSSSTTGESRTHTHPHSLPLTHTHASSLPPQGYGCDRGMGVGGHRRTTLLNYENLPSLPPVGNTVHFSVRKKRIRMKMRMRTSMRRKRKKNMMSMSIVKGPQPQTDTIRRVAAAVGFIAMPCRTMSTLNRCVNKSMGKYM